MVVGCGVDCKTLSEGPIFTGMGIGGLFAANFERIKGCRALGISTEEGGSSHLPRIRGAGRSARVPS